MTPAQRSRGRPAAAGQLSGRDITGLLFVAEMYCLQRDHLAAVLGVGEGRARAVAARWRALGWADSARLGPGSRWTWLTGTGLAACGLPYPQSPPALGRLAHLRAVAAVRLALQAAPGYGAGGAYWRSERRLRARIGGRIGLREHLPDGEVHWPDTATAPCAGECWAIEAELTPKSLRRTVAIMRELLTRTGDYGCAAAEVVETGRPPRHARAVYLCAPRARPTVARARAALGADADRIEVRALPADASLDAR